MSIPPAALPVGVAPCRLPTARGELAALRAGPDNGRQVVLVPGFTGSKEDFLPVLPLLAAAGLSVLAIDQRGQFESPPDPGGYSLRRFADDLVELLAERGPAHVVGHSFGGVVARAAALARPDGFTSLTLLDSGPATVPREFCDQLAALRQLVPVATLDQIWQLKEALDRESGVTQPPADVHEFLHRRWLANDKWSLAAIAEVLMTVTDDTDALGRVAAEHQIPLLVMFGVDDASAWPTAEQRDMARRLGAPAVEILGAAHSPAVENPAVTAHHLVEFFAACGDV